MTRPKRKRATVNYYEGEEEELDLDDSYDEVPCGKVSEHLQKHM